eukprot:3079655-Prymnesium_polylepis.1
MSDGADVGPAAKRQRSEASDEASGVSAPSAEGDASSRAMLDVTPLGAEVTDCKLWEGASAAGWQILPKYVGAA